MPPLFTSGRPSRGHRSRLMLLVISASLTTARAQQPVFPPATTTNWTYSGTTGQYLARSIDGAGDVNGDGHADIVIGSRRGTARSAYGFYGSGNGLATQPNWSVTRSSDITAFGDQVAGAGDVDGDGYDDVLVAAPDLVVNFPNEGAVYLYRGGPSGLANTYAWEAAGGGRCGDDDGGFGKAMAAAGDVNGDGYGDVIIGALKYINPALGASGKDGQVWVFHGSPTGLATNADWILKSTQSNSGLGNDVAGAGDVNGDGYDDVVIGQWNWDAAALGRILVYAGSPTGLVSTPLSIVVGEPSDQVPTWFGYSVAGAGDVNGDGYDDVLVGSHYYRIPFDDLHRGRAYLYYGSPTGLVVTTDPNHPLYRWEITGSAPQRFVGYWVAGLGDVNADGYPDVAIGHRQFVPDEGHVRIFTGSSAGLAATPAWSFSLQIPNTSEWTGAAAGDLNASGRMDLILGSPYAAEGGLNAGQVWAFMDMRPVISSMLIMIR